MRHRSKKMEARYVERKAIVGRLLESIKPCQACPVFAGFDRKTIYVVHDATDVHELVSRGRRGSITDLGNLLCVCRFPCHRRITDDSLEAEFVGLALPSWSTDAIKGEAADRRRDLQESVILDHMPSWWGSREQDAWLCRRRDVDRVSPTWLSQFRTGDDESV